MPKIPSYDSQVSIQSRRLTREGPGLRISPDTTQARALTQFGVTLSGVAEDFIKAKADQEYAAAKVEGYKALAQTKAEAGQDNDFQNFEPKYAKKIKEIKETISKTIRSQQAKRLFQQDYELKSTYSYYDIMAAGRKRFVAYDKDLMAQETVATKERYFSASTPGEKQNAKDELGQIFSRRVENKILNKVEAGNLYAKEIADLDEGQAEYDILGAPSYALGELQKGKHGAYKNLAQDRRVDLIKSAESHVEKLQNQKKEAIAIATNQMEANMVDLKIAGTLTEQQVREEKELGMISEKFANSMTKALRNPKIVKKSNESTYNKLALDILDPEKDPEDMRIDLLNNNATGKLSDEDFQILYTFNESLTKDIIETQLPKRNFLQAIFDWSGKYAKKKDEVKAQMFKDYMNKVNTGEDPQVAFDSVVETGQNMVTLDKQKYKIGDIVETPLGPREIIRFNKAGKAVVNTE